MYLTLQGLVLRVTAYKETDALLTLLTYSHGKLTVKARGLRRKSSPLVAPCQLLAFAEFTLFEYRGMYTINEATPIALFQNLRNDLQKLSLGTYFVQVAEVLSQEDMPNPELLSLVLNCLYGLSELSLTEEQVKTVFEMRSACIGGYTPDLSGCYVCGAPNPDRFDLSGGRLVCSSCRSPFADGIHMPVSAAVLEVIRYVSGCDPKRLFAFEAGNGTMLSASQITESYLATQLERGFSTLDFYKSLLFEL